MPEDISGILKSPTAAHNRSSLGQKQGGRHSQGLHKFTLHQALPQTLTRYCAYLFAELRSEKQRTRGGLSVGCD